MPTRSTIYVVSLEHQPNTYEETSFTVEKAFKGLRNANAYARRLLRQTHPDAGEWDDYHESSSGGMLRITAGLEDGDQATVEVIGLVVEDEVVID